jgi:SMI1 / KNR4 family (SUKH-1)
MGEAWVDLLTAPGRLVEVRPGCSDPEIVRAQVELGVTFPESLFSFLQATNGFTDLASRYNYAWTLETIVTENRRSWSDEETPLDRRLLAFGGDAAGGWFCLSLDTSTESPIFHWNWIDGEARRIADGLASFWSGWLDGSVSI